MASLLEDHAKRALGAKASQVYTMLQERLPPPSHTLKGRQGNWILATFIQLLPRLTTVL
jgi:hypothetical protein